MTTINGYIIAAWLFTLAAQATAAEKTKIVLIGKDRDHAFTTHEYMADCQLLANCLKQTAGVQTVVSNGWPKDPAVLNDAKAIVLHTAMGGNVLLDKRRREQARELMKSGVGLTAIHWSTGADEGEIGKEYLTILGGWFSPAFSKFLVQKTELQQADPSHPISRGWKSYQLRDEYYIRLRFAEGHTPLMTANIEGERHTVGWAYERPDSHGGRSFGFDCGHFHSNFAEKPFRQAIVNGILWTAHVEIPEGGAPSEITSKDMELPPDSRARKK